MAKGREQLLGGLRVRVGDDLQTMVKIKGNNIETSNTRIKWVVNPNITSLVEVKRLANAGGN